MPIGINAYAMEIAQNCGTEHLAKTLPRMPDKQSDHLLATDSMVQLTTWIERMMDPELSLSACHKEDDSAMGMLENLRDLARIEEECLFFEDGSARSRLAFLPYQRGKVNSSTGAREFDLS